jgi:hypothetical protein
MARHDVNLSKTQRLLAKASNVLPFRREPIVIPRDKLEVAFQRVAKVQKREKYLIIAVVILTMAVIGLILK